MKELTNKEFLDWLNDMQSESRELKDYIVMVSGPHCVKCDKLKKGLESIGYGDLCEYPFDIHDKAIADKLRELEIKETPSFIVKFTLNIKSIRTTNLWVWKPSIDEIEVGCILDAVKSADASFFHYDEWGRYTEDDKIIENIPPFNEAFYRLIRTVHGELPKDVSDSLSEFENAVDGISDVPLKLDE